MEFFVLWIICGVVTGVIGSAKGRDGFGWFLLGCVLGIFGVILVACMPSLKAQPVQMMALEPAPRAEPRMQRVKICPDCAEEVLADARICKHCRHEFRPDTSPLSHRPTR